MGLPRADILMGWLKTLLDPTFVLMNLTVVQGMVCRREYHGLSGDECGGMPEKPSAQIRGAI